MADKIVKFYHGASAGIQGKIEDGTITESDLVITSDTDELVYIDQNKIQKPLGSSKSKQEWEVNLGAGGTVGGLKTGDTIKVGTNLDDLIKLLTQKSVPATYTQPGVTCRVSAGTNAGSYEVGTEIRTTLQGIFTKNDAGALTQIEILKNGQQVNTGAESPLTSDEQVFTIGDETVTFTTKATYGEGEIKNDNLGQPSPNGHIQAGNKVSSGISFVGKRKLFYGTGVGAVPEVTSEMVRGLSSNHLNPNNGYSFNINIAQGQQYVAFAYPATLRDVSQVMYVETNDTGMASSFTKKQISVQGANGATGADYKVYTYGMATPASAAMTFKVTI